MHAHSLERWYMMWIELWLTRRGGRRWRPGPSPPVAALTANCEVTKSAQEEAQA
jgi:hypothetical protein